jgi:hypothetical protein
MGATKSSLAYRPDIDGLRAVAMSSLSVQPILVAKSGTPDY